MNENLASIQRIIDIQPIEKADSIETAKVLGWEIVIKKGEFKIGDLCTYIQIDTIVPETEQFEFLRERKFRVRSIELRGQISQGLIIPLPEGNFNEGDDVTDLIGVKKYVKTIENNDDEEVSIPKKHKKWWKKWFYEFIYKKFKKKRKTDFPTKLVPKTDEDRIQNKPWVLDNYRGKTFVVTEKLNGSSITIIRDKKYWCNYDRVCSRNFEILDKNNEWYKVYLETNFKQHMNNLQKHFLTDKIIVQGEYIGKPHDNPYKVKNEIRLFNIFVDGKKIDPNTFKQVCDLYNIPKCPFLGYITFDFDMKKLINYAEAKSILNTDVEREGLVLRDASNTISFKVISNKFLLKNEE
jgi:hypothetical protein